MLQVLWYREERVIVPSDTRILESSNNKHTLILRNVEEADFGLYSCTADNLLGRSSQNIELSGRHSFYFDHNCFDKYIRVLLVCTQVALVVPFSKANRWVTRPTRTILHGKSTAMRQLKNTNSCSASCL